MDGFKPLQELGEIEHSHSLSETVFSNDQVEQFTIRNPEWAGSKKERRNGMGGASLPQVQ